MPNNCGRLGSVFPVAVLEVEIDGRGVVLDVAPVVVALLGVESVAAYSFGSHGELVRIVVAVQGRNVARPRLSILTLPSRRYKIMVWQECQS